MATNYTNPSSGTIPFTAPPSIVSETVLLAFTWLGFGAVFILCTIQCVLYGTLSWLPQLPEALHLLALCFLFAHAVLVTVMAPPTYAMMQVRSGQAAPPAHLAEVITRFYRFQFAENVIFWTGLWCVKASFLMLYWPIIGCARSSLGWQRHLFTAVIIFTALVYAACLILLPLACPTFSYTAEECNTPLSTQRTLIGLWFSAVMDMLTDLCILAIPCSLLPAIRRSLSRAEMARVAIVFLLAGLIIAAAIVRIVITNVHPHNPELSSLLFWSSVEASVSVMICSILSVGRLFRAWHDKRLQTTLHLEQWPDSGATLHRPTEPHTLPTSTTGKSWSETVSVGSVDLQWDRQAEMHSISEPERSYFDS